MHRSWFERCGYHWSSTSGQWGKDRNHACLMAPSWGDIFTFFPCEFICLVHSWRLTAIGLLTICIVSKKNKNERRNKKTRQASRIHVMRTMSTGWNLISSMKIRSFSLLLFSFFLSLPANSYSSKYNSNELLGWGYLVSARLSVGRATAGASSKQNLEICLNQHWSFAQASSQEMNSHLRGRTAFLAMHQNTCAYYNILLALAERLEC